MKDKLRKEFYDMAQEMNISFSELMVNLGKIDTVSFASELYDSINYGDSYTESCQASNPSNIKTRKKIIPIWDSLSLFELEDYNTIAELQFFYKITSPNTREKVTEKYNKKVIQNLKNVNTLDGIRDLYNLLKEKRYYPFISEDIFYKVFEKWSKTIEDILIITEDYSKLEDLASGISDLHGKSIANTIESIYSKMIKSHTSLKKLSVFRKRTLSKVGYSCWNSHGYKGPLLDLFKLRRAEIIKKRLGKINNATGLSNFRKYLSFDYGTSETKILFIRKWKSLVQTFEEAKDLQGYVYIVLDNGRGKGANLYKEIVDMYEQMLLVKLEKASDLVLLEELHSKLLYGGKHKDFWYSKVLSLISTKEEALSLFWSASSENNITTLVFFNKFISYVPLKDLSHVSWSLNCYSEYKDKYYDRFDSSSDREEANLSLNKYWDGLVLKELNDTEEISSLKRLSKNTRKNSDILEKILNKLGNAIDIQLEKVNSVDEIVDLLKYVDEDSTFAETLLVKWDKAVLDELYVLNNIEDLIVLSKKSRENSEAKESVVKKIALTYQLPI